MDYVVIVKPKKGFSLEDLKEIWKSRELLWVLALRSIKVRYKSAFIGIGWAIVQPVFQMVIFTLIFGKFAKIPVGEVPYSVFVFSALVPWQFFSRALTEASLSLISNADMIRKVYFPRLTLPLSSILASGVDFFIAFAVLILLMIFTGVYPDEKLLLFPVFLLVLVLCSLGVALWLSVLCAKFIDVKHTIQYLNQIWFFATPVIYPTTLIPEKFQFLIALNPMISVIEGIRWTLIGVRPPDIRFMLISTAVVVVLFISGLIYFQKSEREFADIV